jgi:hypothetical protein
MFGSRKVKVRRYTTPWALRRGTARWAKRDYRVQSQSGDFVTGRGAFGRSTMKYNATGGVTVTFVKDDEPPPS